MKKVAELLESSLPREAKAFYGLIHTWHDAVGDIVARVAMPVKIDKDCLLVNVSDSIWLNELTYMKDDIIQNLAERGLKLNDIRFVHKHVRKDKKVVFVPRTLTDKEERTVKNMCRVIKDEGLRESAESAMRAFFGKYSYNDFIGR